MSNKNHILTIKETEKLNVLNSRKSLYFSMENDFCLGMRFTVISHVILLPIYSTYTDRITCTDFYNILFGFHTDGPTTLYAVAWFFGYMFSRLSAGAVRSFIFN